MNLFIFEIVIFVKFMNIDEIIVMIILKYFVGLFMLFVFFDVVFGKIFDSDL